MADIRIKDLTTTASSTASDDFIAVDGTTNGTRKLNAFSPTFGGNATVTGTLTVNSSSSFAGLIQLNNNVAQYWLDSGATQRRTALVSSGNSTYFGPVDAGWGSTGYFSAGTTMVLRTNGASGTFNEAVSISTGGLVTIPSTSASTTTSTGALVVSGGVGVGGAINCGSGLVANPLFTQTRKLEAQIPHTVSTEDYLRIGSNTGSTNTYAGEFGYGLTAGGSPQIRFNRVHAGTVTTWLTVPTSTGDAEFAGSVKTGAPSGGTAAAWKLGTVATVSPTSPNRTIEVDIGGTIYYLAAKTTNN
jgi:hypothetical protein